MPYIIECQNRGCGLKQYRLYVKNEETKIVQAVITKGIVDCYECKFEVIFRNIKFKTLLKLRELFPNKKVIYTKLSEYKLLELHEDLDSRPYVVDKKDVKG